MLKLTQNNTGKQLNVNPDNIEYFYVTDNKSYTTIYLVSNSTIDVTETIEQINKQLGDIQWAYHGVVH